MTARSVSARGAVGDDLPTAVRRALRRHILLTTLALVIVFLIVVVSEIAVARSNANTVAEQTSLTVADVVRETLSGTDFTSPGTIERDEFLDDLRVFLDAGIVARVKVWIVEGEQVRVVFSDEPRVEGDIRGFDPQLAARLDAGEAIVLTVPDDTEHRFETGLDQELREVFIGFTDAGGNPMRLEVYVPVEIRPAVERTIALQIPLVAGGLLLLGAVLVPLTVTLTRRLHQLAQDRQHALHYALTASERERRDLARRLHDGVVQDLAGVGILLQSLAPQQATSTGEPAPLARAASIIENDTHELRALLHEFFRAGITQDDLPDAIAQLAEQVDDGTTPITVTTAPELDLSDDAALTIYRCAQELIRNAQRHADARTIHVHVEPERHNLIRLRVSDDGVGFDPHAGRHHGHIGLKLVEHSAQEAGGEMRVSSRLGEGTTIDVVVPGSPSSRDQPDGVEKTPTSVTR